MTKTGEFKMSTFGIAKQKRKYYCKCNMKNCTAMFNKTSAWNIHHLVKHKDVKFTCGDCKKMFATPGSFCNQRTYTRNQNMNVRDATRSLYLSADLIYIKIFIEDKKLHVCFATNCNKRYKWRQDLLHHIKNNVQDTLFECKICNYSNYEGGLYRHHVLVHMNKTPYKCCRCPTAFKHVMQHHHHEKICKWAPDNTN